MERFELRFAVFLGDGDARDLFQDGNGGAAAHAVGFYGDGSFGNRAARGSVERQGVAAERAVVRRPTEPAGKAGRHVICVGCLERETDRRAGQGKRVRGIEEQTVRRFRLGLFAHEENEVGARAHRAICGGVGCSTLVVARVLHAHHRRAAAVQVERRIAAEFGHFFSQIVEINTGRITGLVGGVDDERAVGFPADGGSGALLVFRVEREAGQCLAVFYQHIAAAAGVGNALPHIVAERGEG